MEYIVLLASLSAGIYLFFYGLSGIKRKRITIRWFGYVHTYSDTGATITGFIVTCVGLLFIVLTGYFIGTLL